MEQLALFADPAPTEPDAGPDFVDALIVAHAGDVRAVIEGLLLDADFLRDQLHIASQMMSSGMGRGWRPRYERLG